MLTFDRPGYGLSTAPAVPTLAGVAEIVGRLADERGGCSSGSLWSASPAGCPARLPAARCWDREWRVFAAVSGGGPVDELTDLYASLSDAERDLVAGNRADPAGAAERLSDLAASYPETPLRMLDTPQEGAGRAHPQ